MRRIIKNKRGFTLVELLLVIAIIVILAGVTALSISDYINRAKNADASVSQAVSASIRDNISSRENKLKGYGF